MAYQYETVVPSQGENPRLLRDCLALLPDAKDMLRGDANLDWSTDALIHVWEGVQPFTATARAGHPLSPRLK